MGESYFDKAAACWDDQPQRVHLMRMIGAAILREARPSKTMDVLDYGCGTGLIGLFLLPHVRSVTGADNSSGMLERLREKIAEGKLSTIRAVRMDLEKDAVPDDRYHMVVVGMAMHHIAEVDKVLLAFHTMLLPGGVLCIADLDNEPGTFHPASVAVPHHGFDREELKGRLAEHGFAERKDATVTTFAKPVEGGGEQEFSIFLITARRPGT
jgi:ubiquinone/menaquinone biosynthesis C-methylase UbiE